jgi:hypothetical protein
MMHNQKLWIIAILMTLLALMVRHAAAAQPAPDTAALDQAKAEAEAAAARNEGSRDAG